MKRKVLIAEDEEPILALIAETVGRISGIEILFARNGDEALDIARREKPDVAILDILMPGRSGYEVCQALKADRATSHASVIMLSGLYHEVAVRKALDEVGANAYLCKPWSPTALLKTVEKFLMPQHTRGQIRQLID